MNDRLDSIQALRAFAATLVVFTHCKSHLVGFKVKYGIGDAWLNMIDSSGIGQCGVDIFFVISGFIMALVTKNMHKRKGATWSFIKKRLIRIYPPYWIWTTLLLSLLLFFPHLFQVRTFELREAFLSYLLIPYTPSGSNTSPVLSVGWTLHFELYFYFLVSMGLWLGRKFFIILLGALFLITTVLFPLGGNAIAALISNKLMWEFFGGYLLFELYNSGKTIPGYLSFIIFLASLAGFYYSAEHMLTPQRFLYVGVPAILLVLSVICATKTLNIKIPRFLTFLGDSSYTIYLSHLVTMPAVAQIFVFVGLHKILPPDLQIILYMMAAVIIGSIIYMLTEKPLINFLKK